MTRYTERNFRSLPACTTSLWFSLKRALGKIFNVRTRFSRIKSIDAVIRSKSSRNFPEVENRSRKSLENFGMNAHRSYVCTTPDLMIIIRLVSQSKHFLRVNGHFSTNLLLTSYNVWKKRRVEYLPWKSLESLPSVNDKCCERDTWCRHSCLEKIVSSFFPFALYILCITF